MSFVEWVQENFKGTNYRLILVTGDSYPNSLHNGDSTNVTPDIPPNVFAFSGMDWVGASSFGSYPAYNTTTQAQGRLLSYRRAVHTDRSGLALTSLSILL